MRRDGDTIETVTAEYRAVAAEADQAEQEAKAAQQKLLALNEKRQSLAYYLAQLQRETVPTDTAVFN